MKWWDPAENILAYKYLIIQGQRTRCSPSSAIFFFLEMTGREIFRFQWFTCLAQINVTYGQFFNFIRSFLGFPNCYTAIQR